MEQLVQRVILLGIDLGEYPFETSLRELEELTESAGGVVVATVTQKRSAPDTATGIGIGRIEEAAEIVKAE